MRKSYVIYAPPYSPLSAGIKALHMLCDALNAADETADIRLMTMGNPKPVLDDVVVIYPEIVVGNPLNARHVVRWLLYYAGRYRGNKTFPTTDLVFGYTSVIAKDYGTNTVLFLPTVDETVFTTPPEGTVRKGELFYAHKYRTFFRGDQALLPKNMTEITNPGQSREEVIHLLQTSEVFYAYEDTALIIEAVLCGCPVVCVPNEHFRESCGICDFSSGIAWGIEEYNEAKRTLPDARKDYMALKERFKVQLREFIERTQIL